ncbi:hypothetical protein O0L34_g8863 [Tuta absoluta]|nr:hypothetical protein O0L34_g8863 [Tuta absoluta]
MATKVPPPSVQVSEILEDGISLLLTSDSEDPWAHLPPFIITNPRLKIEPEFIPLEKTLNRKEKKGHKTTALIWTEHTKLKKPIPKHPISLSWWPNNLYFVLGESATVTKSIRIMNRSPKIMYIHCCGLWNDEARMGASWKCYPRTRFLLSPGLSAQMYIEANPRADAPVPATTAGLQLATAHRKDTVFGYFVVPIHVTFHNYVPIEEPESGSDDDD